MLKRHGIRLQLLLGPVRQARGVRGGALHGAEAAVGARGRQLAEGQRLAGALRAQRRVVSEQRLGRGRGAVGLGVAKVVGGREVELGADRRTRGRRPGTGRGGEAGRAGLGGWRRWRLFKVGEAARLGTVGCPILDLLVAGEAELVCPEIEAHDGGGGGCVVVVWNDVVL